MPNPTLKQKVGLQTAVNAATTAFVTTADILVGEHVIIAMGRTALSTTTNGALSLATSAGALGTMERCGTACRTSTFDVHIVRAKCTTLIPSGSTITLTDRSATTKRGAVLQVVAGLDDVVVDSTSGNTADNTAGNISGGPNGSSVGETASLTTVAANCLLIGAMSVGGTSTIAPTGGWTEIDEQKTASGSADRGIMMMYKIVNAAGAQSATADLSATGGWAASAAAFAFTPTVVPPAGPKFYEKIAGVWTLLTVKEKVAGVWTTTNVKEL